MKDLKITKSVWKYILRAWKQTSVHEVMNSTRSPSKWRCKIKYREHAHSLPHWKQVCNDRWSNRTITCLSNTNKTAHQKKLPVNLTHKRKSATYEMIIN